MEGLLVATTTSCFAATRRATSEAPSSSGGPPSGGRDTPPCQQEAAEPDPAHPAARMTFTSDSEPPSVAATGAPGCSTGALHDLAGRDSVGWPHRDGHSWPHFSTRWAVVTELFGPPGDCCPCRFR